MPRNGSGSYSLPSGNPVVTGTTISSTWANTTLLDIGTAITGSIAADGQTTIAANLPMSTYRHTNVGAGADLTDYARYDQMQNSSPQWLTSISGVDTITASAAVTPSAYAAGQTFRFIAAGTNTAAVTLNVSSLGAKTVSKNGASQIGAGEIRSGSVVTVTYDGTVFQICNISDGPSVNDFRLTLTTGVPVTTSDVTGASTLYCTPYIGNQISLYDGTSWNVRTSAEFSLALSGLTSGLPYDVFCYDNAAVPTPELLAWTNDTTRSTALAYQDGVLAKSGATTRRYLGTIYTTGTTTTEDSIDKRYLWNYYNRVERSMKHVDTTNSWTYSTNSWRQANGSSANKLNFVIGVAEDSVEASSSAYITNDTGGASFACGVGLNSTSTNHAQIFGAASVSTNTVGTAQAHFRGAPAVGLNYMAWLENATASGTTTWYGDAGGSLFQTGIVGSLKA